MRRVIPRCAAVGGAMIALSASLALAQSGDDFASLRKDIDALKEGQAAVLRELQQIKSLLNAAQAAQKAGPPAEAILNAGDGQSRGSKDARLVLIEFTDYQ